MLKKFPSDKINGTNMPFFSRASTHHSFTFNLQFLYELKHKVRLSKTVCRIFYCRFRFVFIKVYIFVPQNAWILRPFQIFNTGVEKCTRKYCLACDVYFSFSKIL